MKPIVLFFKRVKFIKKSVCDISCRISAGMIFTIEPMVNMGKADIYIDDKNGWEVYTDDGLPSAQWEIMVLVTEDGYEVLSW